MSIHDLIRERTDLAKTYAEDGAFRSAAGVLRQLADDLDLHMDRCDAWMNTAMRRAQLETTGMSSDEIDRIVAEEAGDPVNLQGSGPAPIEPRGGHHGGE